MNPNNQRGPLTKVMAFSLTQQDIEFIDMLADEDTRFCKNGRSGTLRMIIAYYRKVYMVYYNNKKEVGEAGNRMVI